jgi:hypothetical protein
MLSQVAKDGTEDLVSWQPHGKAFRVHKPTEFAQTIMPTYFRQTRYKSFQRQLHIYGFHRIATGIDKGSYWHPMFVKDMESISLRMTRCKIKGALAKLEVADPDFYEEYCRSGTRGVAVVAPAPEVMKTTLPEQEPFGTDIGCVLESTSTVLDRVLYEDLFPPHTSSCDDFYSKCFNQEQHQRKENPEFASTILFGDKTTSTAQLLKHMNNKLMRLSAWDSHPWKPSPNRRGSIFAEGDECIFAGRKFFIVSNTTSLPSPMQLDDGPTRPLWAKTA